MRFYMCVNNNNLHVRENYDGSDPRSVALGHAIWSPIKKGMRLLITSGTTQSGKVSLLEM